MTKRERMIVGAMGVAVVLGGADWAFRHFFGGGKASLVRDDAVPIEVVISQVGAQLGALRMNPAQARYQELTTLPWVSGLFRQGAEGRAENGVLMAVGMEVEAPRYTAHFRIGGRPVGIIGGIEVMEGDWTADGLYRVLRLGPSDAELLPKDRNVPLLIQIER